ncbi:protein MGARP-like isoform X2 [Xyrauchen texanus]|uniref:protein MGARP-like isoform X2 n=1 Tax=Xyrauchen texanus TaxID=154827 RepID=UPI002242BE7D|nr:protein MGARP-like isoform X2 [Xyrauchen texanus]
MMFCRAAWQRLAPLAHKTLYPLSRNVVPTRQMSFGIPASGTNIAYMVLGGGSLTAALVYGYKTINSDSARYNDRIAQIEARPKKVVAVAEVAPVAEAASTLEKAVELATTTEPIAVVIAAEPTPAAAEAPASEAVVAIEEAPAELLVAAVEVEEAIVEAIAPAVEDVATKVPAGETTAITMSDRPTMDCENHCWVYSRDCSCFGWG